MIDIKFYNREKEIQEIMRIFNSRPDLITFIYGPINSGKTELLNYLTDKLDDKYVVFYINLRERMIRDFNDFIEALFEIEIEGKKKVVVKEVIAEITKFTGIPISKTLLDQFFKEDKPKNAFRYIVEVIRETRGKGKMPILIIDELQKIGDIKIDSYLVYELFNLFIRLTKELHICHVFAVTSDSLFIERVYSEAMLQGRCRYLLVDDFDYETTKSFLKKYGFSKEEIELVWNYLGGKPVYLVEAIKNKHRLKDFCEEMLNLRTNEIKQRLKILRELGEEVVIGEKRYEVDYEKVVSALKDVAKNEILSDTIDEITKRFLIRENILFFDPLKAILKPQSKLDLLAIRKVLEVIGG